MLFGVALSVLILGGCVTTTFYKSDKLASEGRRVALLAPDVELSILNAGGAPEPQAEWTRLAEGYLLESVRNKLRNMNAHLVTGPETAARDISDGKEVQLMKLHQAVGSTILVHQFVEPLRLPSKQNKFEWTLGSDASHLKEKYDADYALFVYVRDSYASAGRAAVIAVAALFGVGVQGGVQVGFASLVDLNSGDIVWFNRLARASGDLRTSTGAEETVAALLTEFPQ